MTNRSIHIALTFDDNFWAPAYATMRSVCLFSQERENLVFHLFHRALSDDHRADLAAITDEFPVSVRWYDLDENAQFASLAGRLQQSKRFPPVVYARLMLDKLLPADVERIIYFDCDMMVRDDVRTLYDWDLGSHPVAAVRDLNGAWIVAGRDVRGNRDIFDVAAPYFNSGLLVIDIARWRAANILDFVENARRNGVMQRIYYDQDLLNLIFRNNWQALPWRWNTIDPKPIHESLDPAVLHYTGDGKPWYIWNNMRRSVAYARFYRHVMTNALYYKFARHRRTMRWQKILGRR